MSEGSPQGAGPDRATVGLQGPRVEALKAKIEASKPKEEAKAKKVLQRFVWISPKSYAKVCELAEILKTSTSQVISIIIDDYFERGLSPTEKPVEIKRVTLCPACGQEVEDLMSHWKQNPSEARSLAQRLLYLGRGS
jgi:hypothetical protein